MPPAEASILQDAPSSADAGRLPMTNNPVSPGYPRADGLHAPQFSQLQSWGHSSQDCLPQSGPVQLLDHQHSRRPSQGCPTMGLPSLTSSSQDRPSFGLAPRGRLSPDIVVDHLSPKFASPGHPTQFSSPSAHPYQSFTPYGYPPQGTAQQDRFHQDNHPQGRQLHHSNSPPHALGSINRSPRAPASYEALHLQDQFHPDQEHDNYSTRKEPSSLAHGPAPGNHTYPLFPSDETGGMSQQYSNEIRGSGSEDSRFSYDSDVNEDDVGQTLAEPNSTCPRRKNVPEGSSGLRLIPSTIKSRPSKVNDARAASAPFNPATGVLYNSLQEVVAADHQDRLSRPVADDTIPPPDKLHRMVKAFVDAFYDTSVALDSRTTPEWKSHWGEGATEYNVVHVHRCMWRLAAAVVSYCSMNQDSQTFPLYDYINRVNARETANWTCKGRVKIICILMRFSKRGTCKPLMTGGNRVSELIGVPHKLLLACLENARNNAKRSKYPRDITALLNRCRALVGLPPEKPHAEGEGETPAGTTGEGEVADVQNENFQDNEGREATAEVSADMPQVHVPAREILHPAPTRNVARQPGHPSTLQALKRPQQSSALPDTELSEGSDHGDDASSVFKRQRTF